MLLIAACIVVVLPIAVASVAHARGFHWPAVVGLVAVEVLGGVVIGAGLLFSAFNGSIQDYGEQPARTLGTTIPLLVVGGVVSLVPWTIVLLCRAE